MFNLTAPIIESKLPAQYYNVENPYLVIPFILNRSVGRQDFKSIALKIKTASTNVLIADQIFFSDNIIEKNNIYRAYFKITNTLQKELEEGQFYKVQIAFGSELVENEDELLIADQVGTYSTVGVFKYISTPIVRILDPRGTELDNFGVNPRSFIGEVYFEGDISEKISQYEFNCYDENNNLHESSGILIHDIDNDERKDYTIQDPEDETKIHTILAMSSKDSYVLKKDLDPNLNYYIIYKFYTANNLVIASHPYWIRESCAMSLPFPGKLFIEEDQDEGYLHLKILCNQNRLFSGSYKILRSSNKTDFKDWHIIHRVAFAEKRLTLNEEISLFKDFTPEQGVEYKYAFQRYSSSSRIHITKELFTLKRDSSGNFLSQDTYTVNFEDMFLFDGEKQLKIRFNPKVTSFKNHVLENKIDTIGSQYPFFFRNGYVNYKEFPLSGLISCQMDENHLFINHEDLDTNLTYKNISEEREFKLKVLEWLDNGKAKLFRSPAEGNYIVRLMKVSLKPIDKLGRMLHTFSATAYEVAHYDFDNLASAELIMGNIHFISDIKYDTQLVTSSLEVQNAIYANIHKNDNRTMGQEVILTFQNGQKSYVAIGFTNSYFVHIEKDNPLIRIEIKDANSDSSSLSVDLGYTDKTYINSILNDEHQEIIDFTTETKISQYIGTLSPAKNLVDIMSVKNPNYDVSYLEEIPFIRIQAKLIIDVWGRDPSSHILYDSENPVTAQPIQNYLSTVIYHDLVNDIYYMYNIESQHLSAINKDKLNYHYDIEYSDKTNNYFVNNNYIELSLKDVKNLKGLYLGNALYADIVYTKTQYKLK